MKERILPKYYKFRMAQQGIKLMGNRDNLYYGKNKKDHWFFYLAYDWDLVLLDTCETKLKALFIFNILLHKAQKV